jgi:hypothetical protein
VGEVKICKAYISRNLVMVLEAYVNHLVQSVWHNLQVYMETVLTLFGIRPDYQKRPITFL